MKLSTETSAGLNRARPISSGELRRRFAGYSTVSEELEADEVVLEGHFYHSLHCDGLSLHVGKMLEKRDMSSFVELPAAISFNIIFSGQVHFSVGGEAHKLANDPGWPVECSAITLSQPDILKRRFIKGQEVCKLNLFAERRWLETHFHAPAEKRQLAALFEGGNRFDFWQPSTRLIRLARKFIDEPTANNLPARIRQDSRTLALLACCVEELIALRERLQTSEQAGTAPLQNEARLKKSIDQWLGQRLNVKDMADRLGLSTSTLQRRFKAAYGVTVNSYCRQRRLEMARRALIVDGKSIGEAAYLAGYNHPSNFISAFKRRFTVTPAELVSISHSE